MKVINIKGNRIGKRLFFVTLVVLLPILSRAATFNGYYIDLNSDTIKIFIKVGKATLTEPAYAALQKEVKCKTERNAKYMKIDATMASKFVIYMEDEPVEFVSVPNDGRLDFVAQKDCVFLRPISYGAVTLYHYYYYTSSMAPTAGGGMTSYSNHNAGYLLMKEEGSVLKITGRGGRKKDLMEFFSDYKELARKIETKEINATKTVDLVNEYNTWKAENAETNEDQLIKENN